MENLNSKIELDLINIAYVDESADERDNFFTDAFQSKKFNKINLLEPTDDIRDLIKTILELRIDVLVSDFNLFEASPLAYTGENVVSEFLKVRHDFPCFIRTAFDEYALAASHDVNKIYSKNVVSDESAGRYLFHRIEMQVKNYKLRINAWQDELSTLLSDESKSARDIERIIFLDTQIEYSLGRDTAISEEVKKQLFTTSKSLIFETRRLVADIKKALGD